MARRVLKDGSIRIDSLQDLKRGDNVCVTYWGGKYIKTRVTRVRTVECATIVTVEPVKDCRYRRFVGYYTSRIATADARTILTIDNYWGDMIEKNLNEAEKRSETIITRARALRAMMDLKEWFFKPEEKYADRDPE